MKNRSHKTGYDYKIWYLLQYFNTFNNHIKACFFIRNILLQFNYALQKNKNSVFLILKLVLILFLMIIGVQNQLPDLVQLIVKRFEILPRTHKFLNVLFIQCWEFLTLKAIIEFIIPNLSQIYIGILEILKQKFQTSFWVQNHFWNLCSRSVNSQRLFFSQKAGVKCSS